ncbi:DUF397 domain-containing protein [Salinispora arenicola]|nr:DUF397 domain-containing protein [Salinispora arenicola]
MTDLTWQKPMRCDNSSPNCVEVADGDNDERLVRDSKNPNGPTLSFASEE